VIATLLTAALLTATPAHARPSAGPAAPPYPDAKALIEAMYQRYRGKWYRSMTFVQTTEFLKPSPRTETWYEAMRVPGLLRIDIAPLDSGNTILFRGDSLYRYQQANLRVSRPFVHPLMVLGFDVYADPPARTVERLTGLGFDLSRVHETVWQDRPTIVVGATQGDTASAQFWIDRERLLFVRMLQPAPDGSGAVAETQFNQYEKLGKGWVAVEVIFNMNGETALKEHYADVKAEVKLPDELFEPARYGKPGWVSSK
jgi:hypothetical protein